MRRWFILLAALSLIAFVQGVSSAPRGVSPVLAVAAGEPSVGWLMGGSVDGNWMDTKAMTPRVQGGERYTMPSINGPTSTHTGGKLARVPEGDPCSENRSVTLAPAAQFFEGDGNEKIALVATWNLRPRKPTYLSAANPTYRALIAELLRARGIQRPQVQIQNIVRVDLDGDRQDEVIVGATRHEFFEGGGISPNARAGDYSLILVRKINAGKVQNIMLEGEFYPQGKEFNAPNIKTYRDVLDLNGDGRLEIVFSSDYYEGHYTGVYDWQGSSFLEVLGYGCGV